MEKRKKKNRREASKVKKNLGFTIFSQKISTHILTVLINGAITWSEQRKREKEERRRTSEFPPAGSRNQGNNVDTVKER